MARKGRTHSQIWIVDDDLSFGRSLKQMLEARGIQAEYFGSAQSFLDSVPPGQSGYAIVDICMPGYDGLWLLKKMRDFHYVMPVIMMTGRAVSDAGDLARENGAVGYLQKPFSADSLLEMIRKQEIEKPTP